MHKISLGVDSHMAIGIYSYCTLFEDNCIVQASVFVISFPQKDSQAIVLFKQLFSLKSIVNWIKISFDICDHILHLLQNVQYY